MRRKPSWQRDGRTRCPQRSGDGARRGTFSSRSDLRTTTSSTFSSAFAPSLRLDRIRSSASSLRCLAVMKASPSCAGRQQLRAWKEQARAHERWYSQAPYHISNDPQSSEHGPGRRALALVWDVIMNAYFIHRAKGDGVLSGSSHLIIVVARESLCRSEFLEELGIRAGLLLLLGNLLVFCKILGCSC